MAILSHQLPVSFSNQNGRCVLVHSGIPTKDHLSLHYSVGPLELSESDVPSFPACCPSHYYSIDFRLNPEHFLIFSALCRL